MRQFACSAQQLPWRCCNACHPLTLGGACISLQSMMHVKEKCKSSKCKIMHYAAALGKGYTSLHNVDQYNAMYISRALFSVSFCCIANAAGMIKYCKYCKLSAAGMIKAPAESVVSLAKVLPIDSELMATQPTCSEVHSQN